MPMPSPAVLLPLLANVTSWIMGLQLETNHLVGVACVWVRDKTQDMQ
jgi:hypothetical protein